MHGSAPAAAAEIVAAAPRGEIEHAAICGDYVLIGGWLERGLRAFADAAVRIGDLPVSIQASAFQYLRRDVNDALHKRDGASRGFVVLAKLAQPPPQFSDVSINAGGWARRLLPAPMESSARMLDETLASLASAIDHAGAPATLYGLPPAFLTGLQDLYRRMLDEQSVYEFASRSPKTRAGPARAAMIFVQCGALPVLPLILQSMRALKHQVEIVVANNSPEFRDDALSALAEGQHLYGLPWRYVEFSRNIGFGAACNRAAAIAEAEFCVFHNNDVFTPAPADYDQVIAALQSTPERMIGVRQRFADGSLMHDGLRVGLLDPLHTRGRTGILSGMSIGRGAPPGVTAGPVFTSGSFLALSRALFRSVGGFSEDYLFGHFEDLDLCLSLHFRGFETAILNDTRFFHCEGIGSRVERFIRLTVPVINRMIFTDRWREMTAPWFSQAPA
jgi:GT2 family glycosyltransferase